MSKSTLLTACFATLGLLVVPATTAHAGNHGMLPATKAVSEKLPTMESPATSGADTRTPVTKAMDEALPQME